MKFELDVIIPLWNEEKNIENLCNEANLIWAEGMRQLILVNNGSIDNSDRILKELERKFDFIRVISLSENLNYGGGIYEGLKYSKANFVGFIPGDLQISFKDLSNVWNELKIEINKFNDHRILFKGKRLTRYDKKNMQFVSSTYTKLVNFVLGLDVSDCNGLPKIFHRTLLDYLPSKIMQNFVFDVQLLAAAKWNKWKISEIPVVFHARREGVSSWSGKRIKTYFNSFIQVIQLRLMKKSQAIPFLTKV